MMKEGLVSLSAVHLATKELPADCLSAVAASGQVIADNAEKISNAVSLLHELNMYAPNEVHLFLMDGFVAEIHRIRGLKQLLQLREDAQQAYAISWTAHDKLSYQGKQFRDRGRADKADALEPKIAEAAGVMRNMKDRLDDITKGLINIEAPRVWRIRIVRLRAMFGQYAALCIASGVRQSDIWTSFMSASDMDQVALVGDARKTLASTVTMHAMDANGPAAAYYIPSDFLVGATPLRINSIGAGSDSSQSGLVGAVPVTPLAAFVGSSSTSTSSGGAATSTPVEVQEADL